MVQMRIAMVVFLGSALAFSQNGKFPAILTPANCSMPLLVEGKPMTITPKELAWAKTDNGFKEILDGGSAETDVILEPDGSAGFPAGSSKVDSFFLYTPSGARSEFLNTTLSQNLSHWKWKAATCSGTLLQTLPRSAFVPEGGFQPNLQYTVATLLHIRYAFQKENDQYTVKVTGISFTPDCKEIVLMMFEFRGGNRAGEYPGPTLACKGKNVYEYIPQKKQ